MKTPSTGIKRRSLPEYLRSQDAVRLLITVVGILVMAAIFEAVIVPVRYDLRVGMVPQVTITATKDVVDEAATEKKARPGRHRRDPDLPLSGGRHGSRTDAF